ncbi:MAG: RNA polymerase sigma factor [Candidatus Limnocylindrales bacterium]
MAIAQRESGAFEDLMAEHLDASLRVAVAILGDADEARDATQEAFITAWRQLPRLRDPAKAASWLHRITVNTSISCLRRRAREKSVTSALALAVGDGGGVDDGLVHRESLRTALWQLKPEHRVVLFLRFYEDLTVEQIAERTGIRQGTVKSRLHYGLERLRQAYEA